MTNQTNGSKEREKESNHRQKYVRHLSKLFIIPPIILFFIIISQNYPINNLVNFQPFILPSVAAGISLVIGLK
jgi:ABC-type Na+ efflux pump permease subunit